MICFNFFSDIGANYTNPDKYLSLTSLGLLSHVKSITYAPEKNQNYLSTSKANFKGIPLIRINQVFDLHHPMEKKSIVSYEVLILNSNDMSVLKVVEILGNSTVSWEDAVQQVVNEASKTIQNIKSVYVQDMQAMIEDNKIVQYRVNAKVTFAIMDH